MVGVGCLVGHAEGGLAGVVAGVGVVDLVRNEERLRSLHHCEDCVGGAGAFDRPEQPVVFMLLGHCILGERVEVVREDTSLGIVEPFFVVGNWQPKTMW